MSRFDAAGAEPEARSVRVRRGLYLLAVALIVLLRGVALDSDAYPRLSWSSALLTDEGFYLHNARNVVLFHRFATDQFNNALIMPLLHFVQVGWFRAFGVSAISARLLSVSFSLATLALFWAALCRVFGRRAAWTATILLGLDHVNLLYSRLALMDTPAAFWMVAVFWAFVVAQQAHTASRQAGAYGLCGCLLGAVYATRGVAAFLVPVPFALLVWQAWQSAGASRRAALRGLFWCGVGLALALVVYAAVWYFPNRAEIVRVNHYYALYQVVPQNSGQFWKNIWTALWGNRGVALYLVKHTPVTLGLALFALVCAWPRRNTGEVTARKMAFGFLALWLALGVATMVPISYAPSRYYVLFYPALMGLAALGVERGVEWMLHTKKVGGADRRGWLRVAAAGVWLAWNLVWTGDWLLHLTYRQRDADRWLAQHLPPNSVLFGATAAGLCLNNRFEVVHVQEALCNDVHPLERFAGQPRYVVILDGRWREKWWDSAYPEIVAPPNRIHVFPHVLRPFFYLGLYRVPTVPAQQNQR